MPITADRFENIQDGDDEPTPRTNPYEILSFLKEHAKKAFTQGEIAESTGVTSGSVGPTLVRLHDRGRLEHKGKYWWTSNHVLSLDDAVAHGDAVATSREDKSFAYDEWQEHAVDPREQRE